jgi:gamma-glutamyl hercynylcysteine S-oxide hydrolase
MCRHLAYLGRPRRLGSILLDPPHSLLVQSYKPERQVSGHVNADGFGVGWYVEGDPVPARYRRDIPIWADETLPDLGRVVRSGAVLAAVRCGTPGMGYGAGACAPFRADRWLFSLNGAVPRWRELATGLDPADLLTMEAPTDAVLLWLLLRQRLAAGAALPDALAEVSAVAGPLADRLNLLITDGTSVAATAYGDSLFWRHDGSGVLIASEPTDGANVADPGNVSTGETTPWLAVPDRHVLHLTPDGVQMERL